MLSSTLHFLSSHSNITDMSCHCVPCELPRCTAFINLENYGALQICSIFHCQPVFLRSHSLHCLALLVLPFASCHWQEPSAGAHFSCWITDKSEKSLSLSTKFLLQHVWGYELEVTPAASAKPCSIVLY